MLVNLSFYCSSAILCQTVDSHLFKSLWLFNWRNILIYILFKVHKSHTACSYHFCIRAPPTSAFRDLSSFPFWDSFFYWPNNLIRVVKDEIPHKLKNEPLPSPYVSISHLWPFLSFLHIMTEQLSSSVQICWMISMGLVVPVWIWRCLFDSANFAADILVSALTCVAYFCVMRVMLDPSVLLIDKYSITFSGIRK